VGEDLPVSGVVPVSDMRDDDDAETKKLQRMEKDARDFITHFDWCRDVDMPSAYLVADDCLNA
jgi:hypothetical protein